MSAKVTVMVLKVDLQCKKCCKKVKKVLSKFPEIQDQTYDEKQNTVTIKVVSCCPEKLRDKICCKGGGSIKSIEIKPEKPKEPEKKKEAEKPKEPEKKKEAEKPKEPEKKKEPEKTKEKPADKPKVTFVDPPKSPPKTPVPVPVPVPVPGYPPYYLFGVCCPECYHGGVGGPCYHGGGPTRYYDRYCGRPVYDSWGGSGGGCTIM